MDAGSWSSFIFQAAAPPPAPPSAPPAPPPPPPAPLPPPPTGPEALPVELLPVLGPDPPPPGTTVDPAALKPPPPAPEPPSAPQASPQNPPQTPQNAPNPAAPPRKSKSKGPYICALCAKEFKNGYNLRRHEATHAPGRAAAPRAVPTMVPLSLLSVAGLDAAGGGGGGGGGGGAAKRARKSHACEMCGKAFRDVYHLKRHKLSHSDEKPFQCPVCQQRFKRKDRMSYHVRCHEGAVHKPYVCSHCGKSFSRPDHLNSHVRQVHSTERPFKCETCEAAFATKDRLRAHAVRHEEKVPCHVCGKMLSAAYIADHMKVHGQGPSHVCALCNKGFTTAAYLRVHAVKDHGAAAPRAERLQCRLCGVSCKTPAQLSGHLQTHAPPPATPPNPPGTPDGAQAPPPLR